VRFYTVANVGTVAHARVLARGLGEHVEASLTVLFAGPDEVLREREPFEVVTPAAIGASQWRAVLEQGRFADLTEYLKPHLLSAAIDAGDRPVVWIDVAADVHSPLDTVAREVARHGAVATPRLLAELPRDGQRPDAADLRRAGRLGAALTALSPSEDTRACLVRWKQRVAGAVASLPPGPPDPVLPSRALTRWVDLRAAGSAGFHALDDPASGVSYWNLHCRRLSEGAGGAYLVQGRPLRLMHFEGFDPARPHLLRPGADRVRTSADPALATLCRSYAERLREHGWRDLRRRTDVGLTMANGMLFDNRLSYLIADAALAGHEFDPFSDVGAERFLQWLEQPGPEGAVHGVSRYLYRIYSERDDLRIAYPDLNGADGRGFAGWAWVYGADEMEIPQRFLPPLPSGIVPRPREQSTHESLPRGPRPDMSMQVTGLLTGTLGLGEAARGYVRALQAADIPVSTSTVDVSEFVQSRGPAHEGYARVDYTDISESTRAGFNLVCINADELPTFARTMGESYLTERPSIGVWGWETDAIPARWREAFPLLDEIWVYSTYVAANLARVAPIPVRCIPPPVSPPEVGDVDLDLGLPDGFRFLFMFDFFSTIQRKNPVGLIHAFQRAFEPGEGQQLVIKTINGVHRYEALEEVLAAAGGRPDIHVVDRSLSGPERDALVAGCDCYVSLHRSEGFGLTLAECMALGKPVIGTGFSATTDFMTEDNSYPVGYELTRVGADCEIYPPDGTWAEPDLEQAARHMRRVIADPDEARAKGERARARIEELYSPGAVGGLIRARLEEIAAQWK
jgi:glycosyltransferase involved in cell wall biosynthesis